MDYGTEEVIKAFHEEGGLIDAKSAPAKIAAAILTIGLGGSAGLEGPSIHVGAVAGSWLQGKLERFGFQPEDRRWMMLAGAAAISYAVSGRIGLSSYQRYGRETVILKALNSTASKSMTRPVITVPASTPISDFVRDYLVKYRHKSFPVERDGKLFGMVGITDIREVAEDRWNEVAVGEVASAHVATVFPDEELSVALNIMESGDFDRLPVVSREDPNKIVGIIALTDIVRLEELSQLFHTNVL